MIDIKSVVTCNLEAASGHRDFQPRQYHNTTKRFSLGPQTLQ